MNSELKVGLSAAAIATVVLFGLKFAAIKKAPTFRDGYVAGCTTIVNKVIQYSPTKPSLAEIRDYCESQADKEQAQ